MKRISKSILTTSLCIALSVLSFTLSTFAATTGQPTQSIAKNESDITLTETQIKQLKTTAEQTFKKTFGFDVDIPKELKVEYDVYKYNIYKLDNWSDNGVIIKIIWTDGTYGTDLFSEASVFFMADFQSPNFPKETPTMYSFIVKNGFDVQHIKSFENEGAEVLRNELNVTIPKDYLTRAVLTATFAEGEQDTGLQITWIDKKLDRATGFYSVMFDKVDLSKNTGRVTGVTNTVAVKTKSTGNGTSTNFTENQKNQMLSATKKFLTEKGIAIGQSRGSYQVDQAGEACMWFVFYSTGLNDSIRGFVDVYITPDLKILGYSY